MQEYARCMYVIFPETSVFDWWSRMRGSTKNKLTDTRVQFLGAKDCATKTVEKPH